MTRAQQASKYFVRASADAPERGPYTRKQLVTAYERALLGANATARVDGSAESAPLKDVVATILAARAEKKRRISARSADDEAHALAGMPKPRGVHLLVWLGVLVGVAGVVATVVLAGTGSPASTWPMAMTLAGVAIAVRGLIHGAIRRDNDD